MARASMASLITRTRTLINDPAGVAQTFTDDQVQERLDSYRVERRWIELLPQPSFYPGGNILYLDYYADSQNWEDDILLQNPAYTTVTPVLSENLVGHWQFAQQPDGIGLRATGKTYDLYAAAADLLEQWAAMTTLEFQMAVGHDTYFRQQKFQMLTALAKQYRSQAQPVIVRMVQSDANPDHRGGGVVYPDLGPSNEF